MIKCDLIVKGEYILPMDDEMTAIKDGGVVIKDNIIISVASRNEINKDFKAKEIIDTGNSIIMPGMINMHTHIAMSLFRGMADDLELQEWLEKHIWPAEAKYINPEFIRRSSELGCLEMLLSGTTCFNDMYFFSDVTANIARRAGMRACLGEGIINFPTPSAKTPEEAIDRTLKLVKEYKNDELINIILNPHSIYTVNKKLLIKIRDLANQYKLPVHIHISETKEEFNNSIKVNKVSPVEFLSKIEFFSNNVIAAHSVWLNDKDINIYKKSGVKVAHCPTSNLKLASGIAPLPEMLNNKIVVGLGTDGAVSNNTQNLFSEMRTSSLLYKAYKQNATLLKTHEVVKMATINGAKALSLDNKIGSLEIGKRADLITINLDKPHLTPMYDPFSHLVYCANAGDVENVIINGQLVIKDREVKTLDEERIIEQSKKLS